SPGQSLDQSTRAVMEARFAHHFPEVRIHADARAGESARALNAQAYTVGSHIVFGAGRYSPQTSVGRHLIAHELAHSLQQAGAPTAAPQMASEEPGDSFERAAEAAADAVSASNPTTAGLKAARRQP